MSNLMHHLPIRIHQWTLLPDRGQFMNAGYRQRSVSHGETDALGGTGSDIAGRKNPRDGGFQWTRFTVRERPASSFIASIPVKI